MRRFALRRLRGDEGLGLLETVAALFVFSLIMTGLAGSMIVFAHGTTLARARASAATLAQQYVEKARAVGSTLLENCSNQTPTPPATTSFHGKSGLTVVTGTDSNCIKYQTTATADRLSFSVTRLVILVQASQNDVAGNAQNEKYFVVQISWTDAGGATKTYELDTIFNQKGTLTAAPAQGIRFVIKDASGSIITADTPTWNVTVKDSSGTVYTAADAATAEGTYSQIDLSPGTYTCSAQMSAAAASAGYYPGAQSSGYNITRTITASDGTTKDTISGSCSVTAGTVTDFDTTWQSLTDCATSTSTGTVNFLVTNASTKAALSGMTVTMTNVNDSSKKYTKNTGANGHADGLKPPANFYTYTVTDSTGTYVSTQNYNVPYCVVAGSTVTIPVTMTASGSCATTGSNATVNFTVEDASTKAGLGGYKVTVVNASTGANAGGFPANTSPSGTLSKAVAPGSYYYRVTPPGAGTYQGSGYVKMDCLTASETRNIPVDLNLQSSQACSRQTGKAAYVTMTVTDMANTPVSGATIQLLNMNGDGDYTATTGTDGKPLTSNTIGGVSVKSIKVNDVDPYQYVVIGPDGNYLTTYVLDPICTALNALTTVNGNVQLQGLMNITVTVRNNDTGLPWKNYRIDVKDSNGNTTSQYVTVPNCTVGSSGCTRNPSPGVTFSGLTTGSYVVEAHAFLADDSNDNLVDTAPTQPVGATTTTYYQFLTPGTSYTASTNGYGDLTLTDDTNDS